MKIIVIKAKTVRITKVMIIINNNESINSNDNKNNKLGKRVIFSLT